MIRTNQIVIAIEKYGVTNMIDFDSDYDSEKDISITIKAQVNTIGLLDKR